MYDKSERLLEFKDYFDKMHRVNIRFLNKISESDLRKLDDYFIKNKLNTLNPELALIQKVGSGAKMTLNRIKLVSYIENYTLNDLTCKGNNCNNMVSFHNSKPGNFCSTKCKKNSQYLAKISSEKFSNNSRVLQSTTKIDKKYGENAKYLKDKNLFINEFTYSENSLLIFDYKKAISVLGITKLTLQKYIRKFNIDVKSTLKSPQTEEKVLEILVQALDIKTNFSIIKNNRKLLDGKELDFYIPEYNFGIETNGIYWHSYGGKDRNIANTDIFFQRTRHKEKVDLCESKDIHLFQINEDEIKHKLDIWKSKIFYKLNTNNQERVFGRDCEIQEINSKTAREFLEKTHLQGYSRATIKLGLVHKKSKRLLSVMTFGKPRFNKEFDYELIRFSSELGTIVIGGASKLFKYFLRTYNPENILTYGNRRWVSKNNIYSKLGFEFIENTNPSYYYYNPRDCNIIPRHRSLYQKHKLKDLQETKDFYDVDKTEEEIMFLAGFRKMYDAGQLKYSWKKENNGN
jgi:hypothetical protein